ncbi:MAG TPA: hypothetical protein VHI95_07160 [Acidimicrobiales bacterium]|nr:hypothetical protein [Acidimicrobiales bacterium]
MRTHVEFRSRAFPALPGEDREVNPGQYGKALAMWMREALAARGEKAYEPIAEDWGWVVALDNSAFSLWIGCANYEEYEHGFLCFIHPSKPVIRKGFRKVDTTDVLDRVASAIDDALRTNPDVHDLRWWTDEESRR